MTLKSHLYRSKKLIIYCSVPIYDTWPKKYKLDEFKDYGLNVELWSTEEIFFKLENIVASNSGSKNYSYSDINIIKIKNLIDLEKRIAELDSKAIVAIMALGTLNNDNPDLKIFNKYKIKYIMHHLIPYPYIPNFWSKLKLNLKLLKIRMKNYRKNPSLIIGAGSEGRKQVFKIYKKNTIYKSVPSFNILWNREKPIINEKYIVYVDEAVNSPPDAHLFGSSNPTHDIEGFYHRINNVFDKIEEWTNFKVIIAASGKYDFNINPFKNREIIYKKTSNLIQHSELVIGHKSSGLDQAIVDYKPIFIFKDRGFNNEKNRQIEKLARVYGINFIWTDQLTRTYFENNNNINRTRNQKIIRKYFREDNVKGSFIENVSSVFHQI